MKKTAKVQDSIQFKLPGKRSMEVGKVVVLRENSVIVEYGENDKTGEPLKTIVNHKNYTIIE